VFFLRDLESQDLVSGSNDSVPLRFEAPRELFQKIGEMIRFENARYRNRKNALTVFKL